MPACPLCSANAPVAVLERDGVPVHQNVVCATPEEARAFPRGELQIVLCPACGFVYNAAFDPGRLRYSASYDNTQIASTRFQDHLREQADHLRGTYGLAGRRIVEIGCGKGTFLRMLCAGGRNHGVGFDPTYVGPDRVENGAVRFIREFYGPEQPGPPPDFVCCQHVIEHVPQPLDLLRSVRAALGNRPDVALYFETPDLHWILERAEFWDFFYEHCSYFTPATLAGVFTRAGFTVIRTRTLFGGQYFGLEARPAGKGREASRPDAELDHLKREVGSFRTAVQARVRACGERLEALRQSGGGVVWGAASKGVTLANTLDPERRAIRYLVDLNPAKQGRFVPGTGHPIRSPEALREPPPAAGIVALNPNYLDEIRADVERLGVSVPVQSW